MSVKPKKVRKILTNKIRQLYDIVADIDTLLTEMETDFYRVCIFGSARIRENSPIYNQVDAYFPCCGRRSRWHWHRA